MRHQLIALSVEWAPKIKNSKSLYAFRVSVRQKVAEFKTTIEKEFEPDKLRDIILTRMHVNPKLLASQNGLVARKEKVDIYQAFTPAIKVRQKDDHTGLHNVDESQDKEKVQHVKM